MIGIPIYQLGQTDKGKGHTALSFSPSSKTSSIRVKRGILLLSASSWKSLGSYATLLPEGGRLGFGVDLLPVVDEDGFEDDGT